MREPLGEPIPALAAALDLVAPCTRPACCCSACPPACVVRCNITRKAGPDWQLVYGLQCGEFPPILSSSWYGGGTPGCATLHLQQAPEGFNNITVNEEMIGFHLASISSQLHQAYAGMALAVAAHRPFISPKVRQPSLYHLLQQPTRDWLVQLLASPL